MTKSVLTINETGMCIHYACFLFFMAATVTFFIADILDPPPKNLSLHLSTEIIKLISSATVQLSLGIVMNLLINESEKQSRMMVGGDHSSSFTSASSYLYSRNQSETS